MARAYVYNPLKNLVLKFDGKEYEFPRGKITTVDDQKFSAPDMYAQNHPSDPKENAMLTVEFDGLKFARMLMDRQRLNLFDAGVVVSAKELTESEKKAADLKCREWKIRFIDEQMQERSERRAGGKGRLALDQETVEWMVEMNIEDELYNPNARQLDMDKFAEAIARGIAAAQKPQPESAGVRK